MITVLEYPKCSTCIKAKKWLKERGIEFNDRHITEENPTKEELKEFVRTSGLPVKKFFNTGGRLYKEMNLKDKLDGLSDDESFTLLSGDGMLVKRPLVIGEDFVLVGFKENEWVNKFTERNKNGNKGIR